MNTFAAFSAAVHASTLAIVPVATNHIDVLTRLFQFYLYDSSARQLEDVADDGCFELPIDLSAYATDPAKSAALIRIDKQLAGFLLTEEVEIGTGPIDEYADLFILPLYRRQGVASEVVRRTLAELPRRRLLCVHRDDVEAQAFWDRAFAQLPFRSVREFDDPAVPHLRSYLVNEH